MPNPTTGDNDVDEDDYHRPAAAKRLFIDDEADEDSEDPDKDDDEYDDDRVGGDVYATISSTAHAPPRRGRVRHEQQYSPRSASEGTCTPRTAVQPALLVGRDVYAEQYSPRSASEGTCTPRTAVQPTLSHHPALDKYVPPLSPQ